MSGKKARFRILIFGFMLLFLMRVAVGTFKDAGKYAFSGSTELLKRVTVILRADTEEIS